MGIYNSVNVWTKNVEDITTILTDYYQELFTTSNSDLSSLVLDQSPHVIIENMNN